MKFYVDVEKGIVWNGEREEFKNKIYRKVFFKDEPNLIEIDSENLILMRIFQYSNLSELANIRDKALCMEEGDFDLLPEEIVEIFKDKPNFLIFTFKDGKAVEL